MGTLYENIMFLCEQRGIKGSKLCADTGISKSILTDLKMGRKFTISAITAQKIAAYFDVSVAFLIGEEDQYGLTKDNWKLMGNIFRGARIGAGKTVEEVRKEVSLFDGELEDFEELGVLPNKQNGILKLCAAIGADPFKLFGEYAHMLFPGKKNKPTDNGELSQKDIQLVNWFRSLPKETRQAILTLGAAPKGLDD